MIHIRPATPADAPTILRYVQALATYEREPDAVEVTVETLRAQLGMPSPPFEALIVEDVDGPVGMAVFFSSYSTWTGRQSLYLEDLFVDPNARGRGFGKAVMAHLARVALDRGCARFEWSVLDWNGPAITFYDALGARPMGGWSTWRISGDALRRLASS